MSRQTINARGPLRGRIRVPGDKSITHRAALVAGVGQGSCRIEGASTAADVTATIRALRALTVVISDSHSQLDPLKLSAEASGRKILVDGHGWDGLRAAASSIDCQNSGTTVRTLLGILAGRRFEASVDGDASLRNRPMLRVVEPLRRMGATVEGMGDRLPLTIRGGDLTGIDAVSTVPSAQVKTAILFAGLQARGETSVTEPALSRDHTERMLEYLGVPIHKAGSRVVVKSTNIFNVESLSIPGDVSSAAFWLVAAAIVPESEVTVENVGLNPTRTGILEVLEAFGARVRIDDGREECGEPRGTVTVGAGERRAVSVGGSLIPRLVDELPLVALLGAFADGETIIRDAAELRIKESDRIAATAASLERMGVAVEPTADGLIVRGGPPLHGAPTASAGDHRIAMMLAVAGLAAEGETSIEGWQSVAVSYPEFLSDLDRLTLR